MPCDRREVERRRQVVDDGVEQRLHALVLERRAVEDGHDARPSMVAVRRAPLQVVGGDLLVADELLEDGRRRSARATSISSWRYSSAWSCRSAGMSVDVELGAQLLVVPDEGLHLEQVDRRPGSCPRRRSGSWMTAVVAPRRSLMESSGGEEVGAEAVHLVDEAHAGDVVLVGLAPDRLGLGLDAGDAVEHGDGAVEHAQRALDLDGEVDVAGRVDDVDAVVVPERRWWRRT